MKPAPSANSQNYIRNYDNANGAKSGLVGFLMDRGHRILEDSLPENAKSDVIVEVGAGTGHHFPHVKKAKSYYLTDASSEMLEFAKKNLEGLSENVIFEKQDATKLTYPDHFCDRLIATHVLEHLMDPVKILAEWDRVVKPGGILSFILPCDPGLLWRFGRHFGPRRKALAAGISYDYVMAAEHVNHITGLVTFIRHHFDQVNETWYPTRIPWSDINLFYICHVRK
ncbi:MAG: class I SAM-dependent methyltransferase [Bdellovibrio sp. CG10_big_fil_rev_8_21_14_0_10_47_8]|nr:MAG: class I SAM-dependent methyltransferase [Bdellovibrio sp. CG10_big_fil_rev_8_21_14_0_10_47_8]